MSKRTPPPNVTMTGDSAPPATAGTVAAIGHAGHVIRIHADYAVWCENDSIFLSGDSLTSGKRPGV